MERNAKKSGYHSNEKLPPHWRRLSGPVSSLRFFPEWLAQVILQWSRGRAFRRRPWLSWDSECGHNHSVWVGNWLHPGSEEQSYSLLECTPPERRDFSLFLFFDESPLSRIMPGTYEVLNKYLLNKWMITMKNTALMKTSAQISIFYFKVSRPRIWVKRTQFFNLLKRTPNKISMLHSSILYPFQLSLSHSTETE